ncbi:hypothetical protein AAZV13_10G169500 [Glycine max]
MATQNHYCVSCTSHFLKILTYPFYLFPLFHLLSPVADAQPILFFSSRNAILILLLSSSLLLQLKSSSCSHQRLQRKSLSPPPMLLPASSFQRFTFTLWTCYKNRFSVREKIVYRMAIPKGKVLRIFWCR